MKAIIVSPGDTNRFEVAERDSPTPGPHDLVVEVKAVSVNPVDTKVRAKRAGRILGWDASGVVVAAGAETTRFRVGDEVFYAGEITREGTNAELHAVDERLVGRKPRKLDHLHAASVPLTALTAWEGLYEQLGVKEGSSILVLGAAGGVGSLVLQMAKRLSKMTVVGTATREETITWARTMGADHVISHREDMPTQLQALGLKYVDYIFCCYGTESHFDAMTAMIAPQGRIVSIVEAANPLPISKLMGKKASFSWELMFAKAVHKTPDMDSQHTILSRVADLIDEGVLTSTLTLDAGLLEPDALAEAHRKVASGTMIGKLALRAGA